jgi:ABC-type amino acid transport substrate-binding protein
MTKKDDPGAQTDAVRRRSLATLAIGAGMATLAASGQALAQPAVGVEDTLDRIKRAGVFNLGAREANPPYGFKNANGEYVGFATEIAQAIFTSVNKELGGAIKLNYIPVTSETRIPLLQNGTIDMEAGATVVTQARVKVVDFTTAHFLTSTEILTATDSGIHSFADLAGKRIGVPRGGLEEAAYRAINAAGRLKSPVTTIGFPDHPQGFTALQTGSVDAYSSDGPILYGMKERSSDGVQWLIFDPVINSFLQAFPIRPESSKFKRIADLTIVGLCASGAWNTLYEKYFGPKSTTPYPMTDLLKAMVLMNSWPPQ